MFLYSHHLSAMYILYGYSEKKFFLDHLIMIKGLTSHGA